MDVALAVFGAQSKSPSPEYLDSIRTYVSNHEILHCIVDQIKTIEAIWYSLAEADPEIAGLENARQYTKAIEDWIIEGKPDEVASIFSGIVSLPRLLIVQLAQYFSFLDESHISHGDFIRCVSRLGGIQGFCGGLPAAVALVSAVETHDLQTSICTAIRLAYAIGLYAEIGDDSRTPGFTTMVVRLKNEGQADELIEGLDGVSGSNRFL